MVWEGNGSIGMEAWRWKHRDGSMGMEHGTEWIEYFYMHP